MSEEKVWVNAEVPLSLRDEAKAASKILDVPVSKVIREALREFIKKARKVSA